MQLGRLIASDIRRALLGREKYKKIPFEPLQSDLRTVECRPGLYDPDQLSRVVACGFRRTLASEVEKLDARTWSESPTAVCELSDACVLAGEILTTRERYLMDRSSPYRVLGRKAECLDHVFLPNTLQGMTYFGHWLRDDCPAFELCRTMGPTVSLRRRPWPDCAAYEDAFDHVWTEYASFTARRLTIIREIGFNLDKGARIHRLRARLRPACSPGAGCVFLARGPSGKGRAIANEAALIARLSANGVRIIMPEQGGPSIIEDCLDAELVITVEGSQAAHATYLLREGGSLLILQPPDRFYNPHIEWTRLLGMHYGIVVGDQAPGGMTVNADEVLKMMDRLLSLV